MNITTLEALRTLCAAPTGRAVKIQLSALDVHCRRFIGLSRRLMLGTADATHHLVAWPRSGVPGLPETQQEVAKHYAPDL